MLHVVANALDTPGICSFQHGDCVQICRYDIHREIIHQLVGNRLLPFHITVGTAPAQMYHRLGIYALHPQGKSINHPDLLRIWKTGHIADMSRFRLPASHYA